MAQVGISVASRKAKARNLQKLVAKAILNLFPILQPDDVRSTSMGTGGVDVQLSTVAKTLFPYSIECKARKTITFVYDTMAQAVNHNVGQPLVILKQDRAEPLVVITLAHFLELIRRLNGNKTD